MSIFLPAQDAGGTRRRRRILIFAAALLLCAGLGAKPAWNRFQQVRARKFVAEGEAFLAQKRGAEALRAGQAALRAGADDARTHRLLLNILEAAGSREAFYFWGKLAGAAEVSVEQRRDLLHWAVAWGRIDLAEGQWKFLSAEKPRAWETLRLGAAYYELRGEASRAVEFAQVALEKNSEDSETRARLGRILMENGNSREVAIGKRLLLEQTQRGDVWGIYALRLLARAEVLDGFDATECTIRLRAHPLWQMRDVLAEANLEARIRPYKEDEIFGKAAGDFLKQKGDSLELARWLAKSGRQGDVLKFISEEEALRSKELLLVYLDALGAIGKWEEIGKILEGEISQLDPLSRALYLARVAAQLKQERIAELRWKQALELAGKESGALFQVADYARRGAAMSTASEAAERLARLPGREGQRGYQELLKIHAAELARTKEILTRYVAAFPEDERGQADLIYAKLLLGEDTLMSEVERLMGEKPEYAAYRTTLALAELQRGRVREAREAFGLETGRWRELLPYQQVIYAATLAAAGDKKLAREIYDGVDRTQVRAEECRLVEKWL